LLREATDDLPNDPKITGRQLMTIKLRGTKMNKIKPLDLSMLLPMLLLGWGSAVADNSREINLQILAINDFHGNIATSSANFGGTGRADFLAVSRGQHSGRRGGRRQLDLCVRRRSHRGLTPDLGSLP
jgi:hypothetical protein